MYVKMKTMICQAHLRYFQGRVHRLFSTFRLKHVACSSNQHKSSRQYAHSYCLNEVPGSISKCGPFNIASSVNFKTCVGFGKSFSSVENENKISFICDENLSFVKTLDHYLQEQENGRFGIGDVKDFAMTLEAAAYTELSHFPWLHVDNVAIAFMQLVMNRMIEDIFSTLRNHSGFKHFYSYIEQNLEEIPPQDYPQLLLSLIYMGTDHTDNLVHLLFCHIYDTCHEMDMHNVMTTTQILRTFRTRSIPLVQKLTSRFFTILDEHKCETNTSSEFMQDCLISHIFLNFYTSKTSSENVAKTFIDIFNNSALQSDPDVIAKFIRYKHRLMWCVPSKVLDSISPDILHHINKTAENVPQKNIGLYCQYLRQMNMYKGELASVFQTRCLHLLHSEDLLVRDVVALVPAFDKFCPSDTKQQLMTILARHISDADVLILSSLADFMMKSNIYNQELMRQLQTKTLEVFDNMSDFISRFSKIVHLLSTRINDNEEFHSEFFERLLKLVEVQQGVRIYVVSLVAQYILPNVKLAVPQSLMDRLAVVIPQCDLPAIKNILNGLNHMKRPWDRQLHHQILELRTALQRNMLQQIETVMSLERLIHQINIFYLKNMRKDLQLLERMMQEMPRLTESLTPVEFSEVVQLLNTLIYPAPQVYEHLTDYIMDHKDDISFQDLANFVSVISQARYTPSRMDELSQCCHDKLVMSFDDPDSNIVAQMQYIYHLCCLQIGSDSLLTHVFTVDYLEKVDKLFEAKPEVRSYLEDLFFRLNRCAVLEYPHLDIPWFHEDYCSTMKPEPMYRSSVKLLQEMEDAIKDVLGGSAYFESAVYTPYHHFLNFECLLNCDGCPIPYPQTSSLLNSEGRLITFTQATSLSAEQIQHQRVAILVLFEKDFCLNSRHLKGDNFLRRRHLEIMGYKVVEIPHYTWNSMALSDWTGKTNYLRDQILG
ncbi:FAST kinase domain-containing protein 1, mitochondrial-like [Gigantopelta aegis]|uniref:FAST kinase domain-containing protein 1, mitochondrial-like n=1 Tax=Gigantopelta aegis TaxID=1735272 RepID=UPI001B88E392|nr:FAST kinase domain-containing protein 1, mitochondrial-like [Gigantopelta aegis]XP_041376102.1 FAST kinase domain-containing protein 1, mitochondrial-like [Gigantopelta aegis]